jgi:hypothetical protein
VCDLAGLAGDVGEAAGGVFAGFEDAELAAMDGGPGTRGGGAEGACDFIAAGAERFEYALAESLLADAWLHA